MKLINNLSEALESGKNMKARIIQKYIETPLLLPPSSSLLFLSGKKFDIRQWVLVKSFNPLTVYYFSSCYLRICGLDFDLNDMNSAFRHFTNYSLNKKFFHLKNIAMEESVCSLETFKRNLKETFNVDWEVEIKPKIVSLVINTLKSVQDVIEQRTSSFEMYGFDVMIDEKFTPWLLEVNLSPACAERTEWLTHMLEDMSLGMFEIILGKENLGKEEGGVESTYKGGKEGDGGGERDDGEGGKEDRREIKEVEGQQGMKEGEGGGKIEKVRRKFIWELIYDENNSNYNGGLNINGNNPFLNKLEIEGVKADLKKEKKIDQHYHRTM